MTKPAPILLLAGSGEAREIAHVLAGDCPVRALLSEPERGVPPLPVPHEMRRFADGHALTEFVREGRFRAVLDASHSFDATMAKQGFDAALRLGLPYVRIVRPVWEIADQPRWRGVASVAQAMAHIPPGARVFATTGWDSQPEFAEFAGARLLLRQTRNHARPPLFDFIEPVFGLAPFTKASETQLFEEMGVDILIARNLGGVRGRPKLDAANALGLDVVLVAPPPVPAGVMLVRDVADALAWVAAL